MNKIIPMVLLAGTVSAIAAPSANAALVINTSVFSPTVVAGSATPLALQGISPLPSQTFIQGNGYSIGFTNLTSGQGVVQGASGGAYAIPVAGAIPPGPTGQPQYLTGDYGSALTTNAAQAGNYLSTGAAGGVIDIKFVPGQAAFSLLWGSVDTSNELDFFSKGVLIGTILGADVQATPGFTSNGDQGPGGSVYVSVNDTSGTFDEVQAHSGVVSFEFAGIVGSTVAIGVPEPLSLALLGSGLIAVGAVRRKKI